MSQKRPVLSGLLQRSSCYLDKDLASSCLSLRSSYLKSLGMVVATAKLNVPQESQEVGIMVSHKQGEGIVVVRSIRAGR